MEIIIKIVNYLLSEIDSKKYYKNKNKYPSLYNWKCVGFLIQNSEKLCYKYSFFSMNETDLLENT